MAAVGTPSPPIPVVSLPRFPVHRPTSLCRSLSLMSQQSWCCDNKVMMLRYVCASGTIELTAISCTQSDSGSTRVRVCGPHEEASTHIVCFKCIADHTQKLESGRMGQAFPGRPRCIILVTFGVMPPVPSLRRHTQSRSSSVTPGRIKQSIAKDVGAPPQSVHLVRRRRQSSHKFRWDLRGAKRKSRYASTLFRRIIRCLLRDIPTRAQKFQQTHHIRELSLLYRCARTVVWQDRQELVERYESPPLDPAILSTAAMSDPSWRPDEDAATIKSEDAWLQGALIMCIAYGSVATLCIQCFAMLARGFKRSRLSRDGPLIVYVVLIFILSTIFIGAAMQFTQQAFVDDRNFPGGPNAYEIVEFSIPLDALANDCLVVSTFLSDALLLWRCTVMYKNSSIPDWVSALLAVAFWLTEFILGVLFLVQISFTSIFGATNFTLAFWCFSLALNIVATIVIVARLFVYRRRLSTVLGKGYVSQYTGIMSMVVESELLYTAFMILYIVPFVRGNSLTNVFVQGPALVQAVAALMIVYRVAQGKGWTKDTYAQMTTTRAQGSTIQLSNLSTLRAAGSTTFNDDAIKSTGSGIQVTQEVYKEETSSV